jgi:hypothetical protein
VVDSRTGDGIEPILSGPFLLRGRRAGGREFLPVEDRIRLQDGSYACTAREGGIRWREEAGRASDEPSLLLEVGGETAAVLGSVGALACPGPSATAFQYAYTRGDDGQFHVLERGRTIGRYPTVSAMRADGFRPVELPLVPEHHVQENGPLARATVVATVAADGSVDYRSGVDS